MGAAERGTFVSVTGSGRASPVHWSSIRLDISLAGLAARLRVAGAPFFLSLGDDIVLDHSTESAVEFHKSLGELRFA